MKLSPAFPYKGSWNSDIYSSIGQDNREGGSEQLFSCMIFLNWYPLESSSPTNKGWVSASTEND